LVLHDWNLETKLKIIKNVYNSLPVGGTFIVLENFIDEKRRTNLFGMMMSLNMMVEYGDAFDFTISELESWCMQTGFKNISFVHINGPISAAIAVK